MARDYANSKAPRKKKVRSTQTNDSNIASFIKLAIVFAIIILVVGGIWFVKAHSNKNQTSNQAKPVVKKELPIVDQRPKADPYEYRKLLESSEIKTDNKKTLSQNDKKVVNTPELIIDLNHKESRKEEAARAAAILNGSLNTSPEDKIHTVKIGQDDKIVMVDGTTFKADLTTSSKQTADQIEADPKYKADVIDNKVQKKAIEQQSSLGKSGQYLMQCAAFKSNDQAVSLKKKLDSKGQNARIIKAVVKDVTWYRVVIGPYASKNMAIDVLTKLKSTKVVNNCNVFLIK